MNGIDALNAGAVDFVTKGSNLGEAANKEVSGAFTIGQDEKSSVVYGMPKVAYDIGAVTKQELLKNIPQLIYSILEGK